MLSNIATIETIRQRNRWDFSSYHPDYEETLKAIQASRWPVQSLGDLAKFFKYGASIPADYSDEGILFIRAQNIREHGIDLSDIRYVDDRTYPLERHTLQAGDILITRSGINVGEAAIIPPALAGSAHGSYSIRLRLASQDVSSEYIALAINSPLVKSQIMALKSRSAQPNINIAELSSLKIVLPPLDIQERIAKVMHDAFAERGHKLDNARQLVVNINNELLQILGVDISLAHVERQFISRISDLSHKWRVENNNLRGLRESLKSSHYPIVFMGELGKFITSRYRPSDTFRYVEIGDIDVDTGTIRVREVEEYEPAKAPNNAQRLIKEGDILVSTRRPTRGAIAAVPPELDGAVATLFFSIIRIADRKRVHPDYVCAFLRTPISQMQIRAAITETTYPVISDTDVARLMLPLPPIEVQRQVIGEISRRRSEAMQLIIEAEDIVAVAKERIEAMMLGRQS